MSEIAIRAEGLCKRYQLGARERYRTLRDTVMDVVAAPFRRASGKSGGADPDSFWALKDVSFEVKRGEVIGVVGRNGAGKSTLLKILSRITEPTEGHVRMHGRVASLLEVGTGFHPELSGRDNIFLNGAILGMKKTEIRRKFDEIVAFAEVEKFVDTPVKHYSSGMYMRLAFAVAAHLDPEILLVDEVLAVGDMAFQKKCLTRMNEVAQEGRTILFVSHNLVAIENLCRQAILLDGGRVSDVGSSRAIINRYLDHGKSNSSKELNQKNRRGTGEIRFTSVAILSGADGANGVIRAGEDFRIRLDYRVANKILRPTFAISIYDAMAVPVFSINTTDLGFDIDYIESDGSIELSISRPNLMAGRFLVHINAGDTINPLRYDHIIDAVEMEIQPADVYGTGRAQSAEWTLVFLNCRWRMLATDAAPSLAGSIMNDSDTLVLR